MIVSLPDFPSLDSNGRMPFPLVFLFGGLRGSWQVRASRYLEKQCGAVMVIGGSTMHPVSAWENAMFFFDAADVVVCWNGNGDDTLYLDEWSLISCLIGKSPGKIVCGMEREADHPMTNGLRWIAENAGLTVHGSLDDTATIAKARCRELRGGG